MLQQLKTSETVTGRSTMLSFFQRPVEAILRRPIPSNFILQKERPVCISIEGHGDHYVERVMQWCGGWVRTGLNFGVVLLLVIVVSTTGVPMSPGHGGYQTATPPSYYQTTSNATTSLLHRVPQVLLCSQLLPEASDYIKVPEY
ncbi:hypothetical protein DAPPUDRAFT_237696 [Daphnia pulex]|uniref:Uncharacterized protein n=1 Tax=Daphnia pulex TaxID=6669 RepID=E9G5M4_DAPPU|nr:hypothetical protein DAPPUDRAFT_237696 [Daphnia pulex]|eukprot:EFX85228.1 hypothetical protein DAPPUDRAFT_237696 [Daphnia pulex]